VDELGSRAFVAARAMVGARFRAQGRDPALGVDCVGLVWAAYAAAGCMLRAPCDYPLRGWSRGRIVAALAAAGFRAAFDAREGDVALMALPAGQFHLGLIGVGRMVHAHAGLRRVVETPLVAAGAMQVWRLVDGPPRCA
jgi:cell wall-associated NlpC family hydrolase